MKDFIVEDRCEPPKFYFDEMERCRTIEFVMYRTVIRQTRDNDDMRKKVE